jgi:murein DD-endopeptidase MepM/ murein hydrolase activator NlpD
MLKNKIVSLLIIAQIIVISIIPAFALSKNQKGAILDNFKEAQYELLFESDRNFLTDEDLWSFWSYNLMNTYGKMWAEAKSKRKFLEEQSKQITNRVSSLKEAIASMDSEIAEILKEAELTNNRVIYTKSQIDTNKKSIELLSNKMLENKKVISEYLVHLYKKWNTVFEGSEVDTLKSIILSGDDIGTVIDDIYYTGLIEVAGQNLVDAHRRMIKDLYLKKVALENEENSLKQLRKALMLQKKMLEDKKDLKKRILDLTEGKESLYQKYIWEKLAVEKDVKLRELQERIKFNNTKKKLLEKYGCEFIDLAQDTVFSRNVSGKCLEMNKIIFAEWKLASEELPSENPFLWPTLPYFWVSAYFNDPEYLRELGSSHEAIDIVVWQGTPIKAPANGYVIYVNPPKSMDYASVAIKHADGFVTVYGHISETSVSVWDYITVWQEFAKTWGEYGTLWAGIMTTGAHLHFELWKDKEPTDPLAYLDTSFLAYAELPEKYKYKYGADFKLRKWYEYNAKITGGKKVFRIEGETEVERQQYLLNTYAVPAFRDWNMWVEEALDANIDPTFMMCVWLAETGLGRNLKTPFNIGNIGNTDSGATQTFPNARSWIYWMTKTFNNRFLWAYTKISELSRYGNKDGSIYASSPDNWHNNVTKCMSHIKQKFIPDDYPFRIE